MPSGLVLTPIAVVADVYRVPAGGLGEAGIRNAFAVTADVVNPAGQAESREQGTSCVEDVNGGSKGWDGSGVPGAGSVEKPKPEDDSAAVGPGEPLGFVLGDQG
jgi:hypothetical protein